MKIIFKASKITIEGKLNDSQTALKIYEKLPFKARAGTCILYSRDGSGGNPRPVPDEKPVLVRGHIWD